MRPTSHPGGHLFTWVKRTYPGHCSWSLDDPNKLTLNHRSLDHLRAQAHDHLAGIHSDPLALLVGIDFFTAEVLTLRGLLTYYVRIF